MAGRHQFAPKIGFHSEGGTGVIELTNFRSSAVINPAIAWLLSGSANVDKGTFQLQTPKLNQSIDFGPVQETITTNVAGDGSVSTQVKEEIAELGLKAVGAGEDEPPVNFSGRAEKALISLGVDGFKSRKAFDLWGFLAAHPVRADLATHEAELKGLLKELAAPGLKLHEGIEAQRTVVTASLGAIALADVKYQLGAANAGPQSSINLEHFSRQHLPVGLLPQCRRPDALEDRRRGHAQGHRYHRSGQRVDLRPQPAGRWTPPVRQQRGQGRGRFLELWTGPDRVRSIACRGACG